MILIYRNHIERLREEERKVIKRQAEEMLDLKEKERKIWISGQN